MNGGPVSVAMTAELLVVIAIIIGAAVIANIDAIYSTVSAWGIQ